MKSPRARIRLLAALALLLARPAAAWAQSPPPPAPRPPGVVQEGGPVRWQEFRSAAGGFRVKFPSTPQIRKTPFTKGPLTFERNTHEAAHGSAYTFNVEYMDLPAGFDDADLTLEGGIAGMTQAMVAEGARVLTREKVARGGCEGREVVLELPARAGLRSGLAHGRAFRSGQRLYILLFVGLAEAGPAREVGGAFMESFVVDDGCRAPVAPVVAPSAPPTRRAIAGTPDPATGWRRIESAEHAFVALMPGEVQLESQQAQVQPIPLDHHEYSFEADESFFSAEVIGDYPADFFSRKNSMEPMIEMMLYTLRRNLEPVGFKLTPLRRLTVGTYPGQEYDLSHEKLGGHGRAQVFITPKRIYIFAAYDRAQSPASVERFFSSIKITPQ